METVFLLRREVYGDIVEAQKMQKSNIYALEKR